MYMLINMLKKQYHEVNQENLKIKTKIKKVRKEKEKVAREVDVMKEIKEDGQLDSSENQERRRRMLLETEWKQKIKKKAEEIEKVISRLKLVKKEMKGENLKHLEKELKFYSNLKKNIEKEIREKEENLVEFKEEIRKSLKEKREELQEKEGEVRRLNEKLKGLIGEKFEVKKEFNELILEEEMKLTGMAKKQKKKSEKVNEEERVERLQLKENIKKQIEEIQLQEEQHKKLFGEDSEVASLRGLHYTNKNEILLNIDCETEVDEDVLFYLKGGRNLELYLELEGVPRESFLKNLANGLKSAYSKEKFRGEVLVKKLSEKKGGRVPKVLGKVVAEVAESVAMVKLGSKEKRNKKIKIKKKKKMGTAEKAVVDYFKDNLQYKVFFKRGSEKAESCYLSRLKQVRKKLEMVEFEEKEEGRGEEAWVRYVLVSAKQFSAEEASLVIGSAFWNTKDSADIRVDDLKRHLGKYVEFLEKKARLRQKKKEDKELEEAAIKIQSVFKAKKARQKVEEMKKEGGEKEKVEEKEEIPEEIPEDIQEEVQKELNEEIQEEIKEEIEKIESEEIQEEKPIFEEEDWREQEEKAAILIQGRYRQKVAKKKMEKMKKEKEEKEQEQAAILIQKNFKRNQAKKKVEEMKKMREEEEAAATLIQRKYKAKMAKRELEKSKK